MRSSGQAFEKGAKFEAWKSFYNIVPTYLVTFRQFSNAILFLFESKICRLGFQNMYCKNQTQLKCKLNSKALQNGRWQFELLPLLLIFFLALFICRTIEHL